MLQRFNSLKSIFNPLLIRSFQTTTMTPHSDPNNSDRPAFPPSSFTLTKPPQSEWKPRQSEPNLSKDPKASHFKAESKKFTKINADSIEAGTNYKLLINGIIPRPIAFVSSQDSRGVRNLAPFSYFNIVSHNPPLISVSVNNPGKDKQKDTAANILATKKFCVSIISIPFASSANHTSLDAPPEISEWDLSGLTPIPNETWGGDQNGPPRVGESSYSLECELFKEVEIHNDDGLKTGSLILGRVKNYFIESNALTSDNTIDPSLLLPVSRGGGITYFTTKEGFEIPRPKWSEEKEKNEV